MMPKWVVPTLLVVLGLLLGNCWRQEGRQAAERDAWKAERREMRQTIDSVLTMTARTVTAAVRRESTLVRDVERLGRTVEVMARRTDSVKIVTVAALPADASIEDSLQAYKALTAAMEVELRGVPGDSTRPGLRAMYLEQQRKFGELAASHAALRTTVADLQATLRMTEALLKNAPVGGGCRIPVVKVSCETAFAVGLVLVAR